MGDDPLEKQVTDQMGHKPYAHVPSLGKISIGQAADHDVSDVRPNGARVGYGHCASEPDKLPTAPETSLNVPPSRITSIPVPF
jgi:hypothetical protein